MKRKYLFVVFVFFIFIFLPVINFKANSTIQIYEQNKKINKRITKTSKKQHDSRLVKTFRGSRTASVNLFSCLKQQLAKTNINISVVNKWSSDFKVKYSNFDAFGNLHSNNIFSSIKNTTVDHAFNVGASTFSKMSIQIESNRTFDEFHPTMTKQLDLNKVNPTSISYRILGTTNSNSSSIILQRIYSERNSTKHKQQQLGYFRHYKRQEAWIFSVAFVLFCLVILCIVFVLNNFKLVNSTTDIGKLKNEIIDSKETESLIRQNPHEITGATGLDTAEQKSIEPFTSFDITDGPISEDNQQKIDSSKKIDTRPNANNKVPNNRTILSKRNKWIIGPLASESGSYLSPLKRRYVIDFDLLPKSELYAYNLDAPRDPYDPLDPRR